LSQPQRLQAIATIETLARADATLTALHSDQTMALVTQQWAKEQVQTSAHHLQQAQQDLMAGKMSAAQQTAHLAEQHLTMTLHESYNRLAQAHRTVLADTVVETLSDMGYTVDKAVEPDRIACWGRKTHDLSIAAVIQEDGRLALDMSGFEDGKCGVEMQEFLRQLRVKGIQMKREQVVTHLKKEGGQLISSAEEQGEGAKALLKAQVKSKGRTRRTRRTQVKPRQKQRQTEETRFKAAAAWLWTQQKGR
jgi:hypothetical protein